jgi:ATP-dependent DNA helicase RecQ
MLFPDLKPFQAEALTSLRENAHTVLVSPTGSGKSLIFQRYLVENRLKTRAIFISPLTALARQVANDLKNLGLEVCLGVGRKGAPPPSRSGIWIVSPEKLGVHGYQLLRAWQPNLLIVDEAHCVWEWGESFRPAFRKVPKLISELKIQKSFWCTATLPRAARKDLKLYFSKNHLELGQFKLPESLVLKTNAVPSHQKESELRELLKNASSESGMIFVSSRKSAEKLRRKLIFWGFDSVFYHAGLLPEERMTIEQNLARHDPSVPVWIVATSAFGMGMNYPFLKTCILYEPSLSLLSLAQALGRVGRSGALATAYVFWNENDFLNLARMLGEQPLALKRLKEVKRWCETRQCQRQELEKYFND